LGVALGTLFALGVVGVGLAAFYVHNRVEEFSQEIAQGFSQAVDVESAVAAAEMVSRMETHSRLVSMDPEEGLDFLQDVPADGVPVEFFRNVVTGDFWKKWGGEEVSGALEGDPQTRSVRVRGDEGEVSIDVVKGKDGASLVIDSDEGRVRFDLARTEDGGFLAIDSEDGQVRFDLVKTEDGGLLTINSNEGEVRFQLIRGDNGGELIIRSDEGTLRFGAGEAAESMPGWVPRLRGMPSDPQGVYSLTSREGFLGAVTWQGDDAVDEVLTFYRELLVREGYEMKARHRLRDTESGQHQGSLWARNEAAGRMVFVVANRTDGKTRILLGYGEKID
jgi:hypothetical protein